MEVTGISAEEVTSVTRAVERQALTMIGLLNDVDRVAFDGCRQSVKARLGFDGAGD